MQTRAFINGIQNRIDGIDIRRKPSVYGTYTSHTIKNYSEIRFDQKS